MTIKGVLPIPQNSQINEVSLSDCLVSYTGHSLGEYYPLQKCSRCILQPQLARPIIIAVTISLQRPYVSRVHFCSMNKIVYFGKIYEHFAQSAGAVEYTDCISAEG